MAAQVAQIKGTHVDAPDSNRTALDIIKAKQQIHQRCLACTSVANNCDGLRRVNTEADVLQYPFLVVVSKPDMIELDIDGSSRKGRERFRRNDARPGIQQFEDALRGSHRALENVVFFA